MHLWVRMPVSVAVCVDESRLDQFCGDIALMNGEANMVPCFIMYSTSRLLLLKQAHCKERSSRDEKTISCHINN